MIRFAAIALALSTGCAATTSALSTIVGGKQQPPITIVNSNTIQAAPAPEPQVIVVREAPAPVPKNIKRAAQVGAVAGAVVGGFVGYALDGKRGLAAAALLGAGTGAAAGAAVEVAR